MKDKTYIGVSGLITAAGSSAVIDLLKEFNEVEVFDQVEFYITYFPDSLSDLKYHLFDGISKYQSSDVALNRFLIVNKRLFRKKFDGFTDGNYSKHFNKFINKITQVEWKGFGGTDVNLANTLPWWSYRVIKKIYVTILNKLTTKQINIFPLRKMYFSISPSIYDNAAKKFVNDILNDIFVTDKKIRVLDQPFSSYDPKKQFIFFDQVKAIMVNRDPRDLYCYAKMIRKNHLRQIPTDNVKKFIMYFKMHVSNLKNLENDDHILVINFEDLIYQYENTIQKVSIFSGISNHINKKQNFLPNISKEGTNIYKNYPKLLKDIQLIELKLGEYLYDFKH